MKRREKQLARYFKYIFKGMVSRLTVQLNDEGEATVSFIRRGVEKTVQLSHEQTTRATFESMRLE